MTWAPRRLALWWMIGTFVAYLVFGDTSGLDALWWLIVFVGCATGAWAWGYRQGVASFPMGSLRARYGDPDENDTRQRIAAERWVLASGLYFVVYGYSLLKIYGASVSTFAQVVRDPGGAYAQKFDTVNNLAAQTGTKVWLLLVLFSVLQLALAPLAGFFWTDLTLGVKVAAVAGAAAFVSFYLYIGTLQGIGFLLVGLLAGLLARRHRPDRELSVGSVRRRRVTAVAVCGAVVFMVYMVNAQTSRLNTFDVTQKYQGNPYVQAVAGRDFARGVAVMVHYPTHGYRGLALNLDTPFEWTEFRGSSRAVDVYWDQFGGGSVFDETYPARTEERTGYSATIQWATVYPWLASDFTWFGAVALMWLLGRWTARMWLRTVHFRDPLALMLFSQLALFVAFVPANNQVLISQPALIAVVTCVGLYLAREVRYAVREPVTVLPRSPRAHPSRLYR